MAVVVLCTILAAQVTGDLAPALSSQVQDTNIEASATWNPTELLSTTTTGGALCPVTVVDDLGNVHVAWVDNSGLDGDGSDADIYYKSLNIASGVWSAVEVVSTGSPGDSGFPALDVDAAGNVYAVWEDNSDIAGSGTDYDILYKVRDHATGIWSAVEVVSSESTATSNHPAIVIDVSSNVHVAWDESGNDVLYKAKSAATGVWGAVTIVSSESSYNAVKPSLAVDASTLHLVYTIEVSSPYFSNNIEVAYRSMPLSTGVWTAKSVFNGGDGDIIWAADPQILIDSAGNRYVVWFEYGAIPSVGLQGSCWFIRPYRSGSWQSVVTIDSYGDSSPAAWGFSSVLDNQGYLHTVYSRDTVINYRGYNGATRVLSAITALGTSLQGPAHRPSIGARGADELIMVWDNNTSGSGSEASDIYYMTTFVQTGIPVAQFTATPTTLHPGSAVQFSFTGSLGTQPSTFSWDFGDGSPASAEQDPSHVYSTAGTYTVSLTVTDADLDSDTETKVNYITVAENQAPVAGFSFVPSSPVENHAVQFTDTSTDSDGTIVSWLWNFGDGTADSTLQNPSHAFSTASTFTITLTVTDDDGATSVTSNPVTVVEDINLSPVADFSFNPLAPVSTQNVQFTDLSSDPDGTIVSWLWNFGDGTTDSTLQNPVHAFTAAGTYTVGLTVTDDDGASTTTSKTITVVAPYMYVQDIAMSYTSSWFYYKISTTVTVYDWAGTALSGVTVTITLRNPSGTTYTLSGVTGTNGKVTLTRSCSKAKGTYTSTVTDIVKSGYVYDPSKNLLTSKTLVIS